MGNQTGAIQKKDNKQCVHHWIIDSNNVGRCIKCGAVKDFGKPLEKLSRELSEKQTERGQLPYKRGKPSKLLSEEDEELNNI